jgi:5-methylcytosine-specific restriction endonuclease McrA
MFRKTCTRCGESKPPTHEFFGATPSGGLRGFCRTCMNKASREYEAKNKNRRRARDVKRAQVGDGARRAFDALTKRRLWTKQGGLCLCCLQPIERPEDGHVDHITPISRGGHHDESNFALAHALCNKDKHNKTITEHWEWRVKVGLDPENIGRKTRPDSLTSTGVPQWRFFQSCLVAGVTRSIP